LKGKIQMITGNYKEASFVLSSEKPYAGSDEGAEELSTTINYTTTNNEQSIILEECSPNQNLNNFY
jgi:hypothetical protein